MSTVTKQTAQAGVGREGSAVARVAETGRAQRADRAAFHLNLIVFVSGGVLMGIEIAGSRVLAPSFGTSIFVWGSLIGLFMGAMAAGYYAGGVLADWRPSFPILATLVSLAGLFSFLLIPYSGPALCVGIARRITDHMGGPLLAATLLFFIPGFLMAMVSPYAVKLAATNLSGLGGVAGRLYALSTAGSIVGTLLTTFVLIPLFQVSNTLQGLAVALLAVAVLSLIGFKRALGTWTGDDSRGAAVLGLVTLGCLELWAIFPVQPLVAAGQRQLHYLESTYHDIAVTEEALDVEGAYTRGKNLLLDPWQARRWLKFNENIESGTYPYHPDYENAVGYTDLLHLPLLWVAEPKRVLVVGGGGAVLPVQYARTYGSQVDVLELDLAVKEASQDYFEVPRNDPRITFHIGDARRNLKRLKGSYDVVILDAYTSGGQIPFHLLTWEFLSEVRERVAEGGVLATNIITAVRNTDPQRERPADLFLAEVKTLLAGRDSEGRLCQEGLPAERRLFQQVYVFPRVYQVQGSIRNYMDHSRNVICLATQERERKPLEDLIEQAKRLTEGDKPRVRVKDLVWNTERLFEDGPKASELGEVPILSDDYAPVDTMYRAVKRSESAQAQY